MKRLNVQPFAGDLSADQARACGEDELDMSALPLPQAPVVDLSKWARPRGLLREPLCAPPQDPYRFLGVRDKLQEAVAIEVNELQRTASGGRQRDGGSERKAALPFLYKEFSLASFPLSPPQDVEGAVAREVHQPKSVWRVRDFQHPHFLDCSLSYIAEKVHLKLAAPRTHHEVKGAVVVKVRKLCREGSA